jgi:predicted RNA-binding Zn ribbon-like protein
LVVAVPNRAPGALGLVQDFVNTRELDRDREEIPTPDALGAWLDGHGLLRREGVTEADHARAVELRETLRRLLLANNGAALDPGDLWLLDQVAADSGLHPRFLPGGRVTLEPAVPGVPGALGRLLAAVSEAMNAGTWGRLKVCADHRCLWAFYDRSKNRSGHWCSMEVCGNRAKARQFRRRQRSSRPSQ